MKNPLTFGKVVWASALGVLIVSVVIGLFKFVMLLVMVFSISSMGSENLTIVKPGSAMVVDMGKISGDRTASGLMQSFSSEKTVGLIDAVNAIKAAANDANINAIYLKDDGVPGLSWGSLTELRDALAFFRESGKPVIGNFTDALAKVGRDGYEYRPEIIAPGAHALIVDDNEMNLDVISGLMERTKIKISTALSGSAAIDLMENKRFDIILLDQMMPGMNGIDTLAIMRSRFDMRGVSVIALTADAVSGAREFYLEAGFDDYLSKPVKAADLEKALHKHIPKKLLLSREEIDRINRAEETKKETDKTENAQAARELKPLVIVNPDSEALKNAKAQTAGIYKSTLVPDIDKARRFLEKHDVEYVMVSKDLFLEYTEKDHP